MHLYVIIYFIISNFICVTRTLWPKPYEYQAWDDVYIIDPNDFRFVTKNCTCWDLNLLYRRYLDIIFKNTVSDIKDSKCRNDIKTISTLDVYVSATCEDSAYPSLDSDEFYGLNIDESGAKLKAQEIWGVMRGIETFSQLVYRHDNSLFINKTRIFDFPRFKHRGILLDTARHFIPLEFIKTSLDAMSYAKFNVFHWHIVDDESFPYRSAVFPNLSSKGAFFDVKNHQYSLSDVREIVEYARQRGIRVIPEFDSPDHSASWGKGYPLLTQCFSGDEPVNIFRLLDPTLNFTWEFWKRFLVEIYDVFPDKYVHFGGDEVNYTCWKSNPNITSFMQSNNITNDYTALERLYFQRLFNISNTIDKTKRHIVWQEAFSALENESTKSVVQIWIEPEALSTVTANGFEVIYSACWYFDQIHYGQDWKTYYECDLLDFNGTAEQKKLVIGGEACLWGEYIDGTNLIPLSWPRAATTAERLWSQNFNDPMPIVEQRLDHFRCLLIKRGIPAMPIKSPSFCTDEIRLHHRCEYGF